MAAENTSSSIATAVQVVPLPGSDGAIDLDNLWVEWWQGGEAEEAESTTQDFMTRRYSLSEKELKELMTRDPVLDAQYKSLEAYYTAPINLARKTKDARVVGQGTFLGYVKTMREFMGYVKTYEQVGRLDFVLCSLDGPKLLRYIAFRKGVRKSQVSSLGATIYNLKAVMRWSISQIRLVTTTLETRAAASLLYDTIARLVTQLRATIPPQHEVDVHEREAKGSWMSWATLRERTEQYAVRTLADAVALRREARAKGKLCPSMASAKAIDIADQLNTALFGMIFAGGFNIGTPRPFLLKSAVAKGADGCGQPPPGETYCSVCDYAHCRGNVIERVPANSGGGSVTEDSDVDDYQLVITHHKCGKKTGEVIPPIKVKKATDPLPWGICDEVFKWGQATWVDSFRHDDREMPLSHRLRLFRRDNGTVFRVADNNDNTASMYVVKLIAELVGVSKKKLHLSANTLRHMYVQWLRETQPGANTLTPEEVEGAAIAMGTSVQMFDTVYQPNRRSGLVERGQASVRQRFVGDETAAHSNNEEVGVIYSTITHLPTLISHYIVTHAPRHPEALSQPATQSLALSLSRININTLPHRQQQGGRAATTNCYNIINRRTIITTPIRYIRFCRSQV